MYLGSHANVLRSITLFVKLLELAYNFPSSKMNLSVNCSREQDRHIVEQKNSEKKTKLWVKVTVNLHLTNEIQWTSFI